MTNTVWGFWRRQPAEPAHEDGGMVERGGVTPAAFPDNLRRYCYLSELPIGRGGWTYAGNMHIRATNQTYIYQHASLIDPPPQRDPEETDKPLIYVERRADGVHVWPEYAASRGFRWQADHALRDVEPVVALHMGPAPITGEQTHD